MLDHAYAVILAGGKGERFWPLSTAHRPKQLLSLVGDVPLLTSAVLRIEGLFRPEGIFVITREDLADASSAVIPRVPRENIIGEPFGRDTAAAVALGAALVKAHDPRGVFCILTADQVMGDLDVYRATLAESIALAGEQEILATIGMQPTYPSTGFGYIEAGAPIARPGRIRFQQVLRFVEKPDAVTARRYMESGRFFWNAGMFIWSVSALEKALARHRPPLAQLIRTLTPTIGTAGFAAALRSEYDKLDRISIDYALMEKADNIVMARGTFLWDDVGSWSALEAHFPKDAAGNVLIGDCVQVDTGDSLVVSNGRLTAVLGLKDIVVVQGENATLVCAKNRAQDVKKIVQSLAARGRGDQL